MFENQAEDEAIKPLRLGARLPDSITEAARFLGDGQLIIFPTDTVYGIGANCFDEQAIMTLFAAKSRPLDKGLPVLLADNKDIGQIVSKLSINAGELIDQFWPGPLTLILRKREDLPESLSPNDGIAVRMPDHDVARAFIRACGGAIASSSANISGKAPAQSAEELDQALANHIAVIIDDGRVGLGRPSTVVDCRVDPPLILRHGPLSPDQILSSSNNQQ